MLQASKLASASWVLQVRRRVSVFWVPASPPGTVPAAPGEAPVANLMEALPEQLHSSLLQLTQGQASPLPSLLPRAWQLASPLATLLPLRKWRQARSLSRRMQRQWQW